ncbi:MAG: hypothetical protein NZ960_05380 [Candidatus Kapabacteria bacterium]|nr:hypothetical protein [Candidatus Kapabacteria bacterium]MDW8012645.1 hypothetical protein [Bacteroidota bacterium]
MLLLLLAAVSLMVAGCVRSDSPTGLANTPPRIDSITISPQILRVGQPATVTCYAQDPDGDPLSYSWSASAGALVGSGARVFYVPDPCCGGLTNTISVVVLDGRGGATQGQLYVAVSP